MPELDRFEQVMRACQRGLEIVLLFLLVCAFCNSFELCRFSICSGVPSDSLFVCVDVSLAVGVDNDAHLLVSAGDDVKHQDWQGPCEAAVCSGVCSFTGEPYLPTAALGAFPLRADTVAGTATQTGLPDTGLWEETPRPLRHRTTRLQLRTAAVLFRASGA